MSGPKPPGRKPEEPDSASEVSHELGSGGDPGDELVLEAAVNGRANAIVTFNQRDFEPAARLFGVERWTPRQALTKLRG